MYSHDIILKVFSNKLDPADNLGLYFIRDGKYRFPENDIERAMMDYLCKEGYFHILSEGDTLKIPITNGTMHMGKIIVFSKKGREKSLRERTILPDAVKNQYIDYITVKCYVDHSIQLTDILLAFAKHIALDSYHFVLNKYFLELDCSIRPMTIDDEDIPAKKIFGWKLEKSLLEQDEKTLKGIAEQLGFKS